MSFARLPQEILGIIAMNLKIEDLVRFQESSEVVRMSTSHVSFYCSYFTKNYSSRAIEAVQNNRSSVPNLNEVLIRLYDTPYEYVHFFFAFGRIDRYNENSNRLHKTECTIESIGFKMGGLFYGVFKGLISLNESNTIELVKEKLSTLKGVHPDLAQTDQRRYFEDFLYSYFRYYLCRYVADSRTSKDIQILLDLLSFAEKENYSLFQQEILTLLVRSTVRNVALGSLNVNIFLQNLPSWINRVLNVEELASSAYYTKDAIVENLPALANVLNVLFKEIVGKRRPNYNVFFERFFGNLICSLAHIALKKDSAKEYLVILKNCLKWRFAVVDTDWRKQCQHTYSQRLCMLDDTIRDIIYPKGFFLSDEFLKDINLAMSNGCSVNYQKACEKCLESSGYNIISSPSGGPGGYTQSQDRRIGTTSSIRLK